MHFPAGRAIAVAACALVGCASHQRALPELAEPQAAMPNFSAQMPRTVNLETVALDMPAGTHIGEARFGWSGSCGDGRRLTYKQGQAKMSKGSFDSLFREVMASIGVPVEQPARFAGEEVKKADLNFAATIQDLSVNECFPERSKDPNYAVGEAYVKTEWSVFSPVERKVVFSSVTEGRTAPKMETRLGDDGLIGEALRQSLVRVVQQPEFAALVTGKATASAAPAVKVNLPNAPRLTGGMAQNMERVKAAVVTIFANAGQGSGFAIGGGDHVLTAAHVVAGSRFVKMKTAGGAEYYGEVLKSDVPRDVALVRIASGSLKPLAIMSEIPKTGAEVFAVGSPLGEKFSVSVTKGVLSGLRTENGRDFLQSDVNVLPGSSGGPLLDGDGNVIGLAVGGVALAGAPVGMNFFAPSADLLKFVGEP